MKISKWACLGLMIMATSVQAVVPVQWAWAGEEAAAATDESVAVENKSDGKAVKVAVVNAIINHVNDTREVRINPTCDLLPQDKDLLLKVALLDKVKQERATFTLKNDDLGSSKAWVSRLKGQQERLLAGALYGNENIKLVDYKHEVADKAFSDLWDDAAGKGHVSSYDHIVATIDHAVLSTVLNSRGIGGALMVPEASNLGDVAVPLANFVWHFTIVKLPAFKRPDRTIAFQYRVYIKTELEKPFMVAFASSVKDAKMTLAMQLRPDASGIGISDGAGPVTTTLVLPEVKSDALKSTQELQGGTVLEGALKFAGGVDLQDVVSHGLFGGTKDSSIYYGALIGQGRIKQLVGVNRLLKSNRSGQTGVGVLLGVAPEKNNALFIGPSLKTGVFTLSAGAMAMEKDNGNGGTRTKIKGGVSLAFDMSQLVGGKKDIQAIPFSGASFFGGSSAAAVAGANYVASVTVDLGTLTAAEKASVANKFIVMTRESKPDDTGTFVPTEAAEKYILSIPVVPQRLKTYIVPRGKYSAKFVAESGVTLRLNGAAIDPTRTLPIGSLSDSDATLLTFSFVRP